MTSTKNNQHESRNFYERERHSSLYQPSIWISLSVTAFGQMKLIVAYVYVITLMLRCDNRGQITYIRRQLVSLRPRDENGQGRANYRLILNWAGSEPAQIGFGHLITRQIMHISFEPAHGLSGQPIKISTKFISFYSSWTCN